MNRPYSPWMEAMSRDSGAGAYSQSALDRRSPPGSPAATGEAGLLTICRWPPHVAATLTYPARAGAHPPGRACRVPDPGQWVPGISNPPAALTEAGGVCRWVSLPESGFGVVRLCSCRVIEKGLPDEGGCRRRALRGNRERRAEGIPDASR